LAFELFSSVSRIGGIREDHGEGIDDSGLWSQREICVTPEHLLSAALHTFSSPAAFFPQSQAQGVLLRQLFYASVDTRSERSAAEGDQLPPVAASLLQRISDYREALDYCFSLFYPGIDGACPRKKAPTLQEARRAFTSDFSEPKAPKKRGKTVPRYKTRNSEFFRPSYSPYTQSLSSSSHSTSSDPDESEELDDPDRVGDSPMKFLHMESLTRLSQLLCSQFVVSLQTSYRFTFLRSGLELSPGLRIRALEAPLAILCLHPRIYESVISQLSGSELAESDYLVYENTSTKQLTIVLHSLNAMRWAHHWLAQAANLFAQDEIDQCDVPRITAQFPFPNAALVRTAHASFCCPPPRAGQFGPSGNGSTKGTAGSWKFQLTGEFTSLQKVLLQTALASSGAGAAISFKPMEFTEDSNDALAAWLRNLLGDNTREQEGRPCGCEVSWPAMRVLGDGGGEVKIPTAPKMYIVQAWEEESEKEEVERAENRGEKSGQDKIDQSAGRNTAAPSYPEFKYQKKVCAEF